VNEIHARWLRRVAVVVGIGAALEIVLVLAGTGPKLVLVGALVVIAAAVVIVAHDLGVGVAPADWGVAHERGAHTGTREWRVSSLRMLMMSERRAEAENGRLYPVLVGLIDDQLLSEHGIDRAVHPEAAHRLLGPELTQFVTVEPPPRRLADPRALDAIVTKIENL
jgi:hypothetical protein